MTLILNEAGSWVGSGCCVSVDVGCCCCDGWGSPWLSAPGAHPASTSSAVAETDAAVSALRRPAVREITPLSVAVNACRNAGIRL